MHQYCEYLDEPQYRVILKDRPDAQANASYSDGQYWCAPWFAEFWRRLLSQKLKCAGVQVPSMAPVLDCCCGHGYLGEAMEHAYGADVTYSDLSQAQLDALESRWSEGRPGAQPKTCQADVLNMPMANDTFELVAGNSFLHHLPDVPAGLAELYRVIRPGGTLAIIHEPTPDALFWEPFPLSLLKRTSDEHEFSDLWVFTSKDLERLLTEAGFTGVRVWGSGILSALLINWYLLLALKLNWQSRMGVFPAYALRVWLTRLDLQLQTSWKLHRSPSLMAVARK